MTSSNHSLLILCGLPGVLLYTTYVLLPDTSKPMPAETAFVTSLPTRLSGQMPFGNDDNPSVVSKAIRSTTFNMEGRWGTGDPTPEARDLVLKLLNVNAKERLTVEGALLHPWIAKQKETLDKLYVKVCRKGVNLIHHQHAYINCRQMLKKSHLPAPTFQTEPIKGS